MKIKNLFVNAVFLLLMFNLNAQTLQEILNQHFQAVGQRTLLEKQTYSIKATIHQMGMEIPMQMQMKRPNKFRMEMEMQGMNMVQAYDGKNGWIIAPWMSPEPQDLKGPELQQAMEQANIDGELYQYAEKGATASLIGRETVGSIPMYNIELIDKDKNIKNYYIDASEFLIRKVTAKLNLQGKEMEAEQNIKEYQLINGVMMPGVIESKSPMGVATIVFDEIVFDDNIDDSIFKKPSKN
jgi:outer membrane lipoprotein-sorting protein